MGEAIVFATVGKDWNVNPIKTGYLPPDKVKNFIKDPVSFYILRCREKGVDVKKVVLLSSRGEKVLENSRRIKSLLQNLKLVEDVFIEKFDYDFSNVDINKLFDTFMRIVEKHMENGAYKLHFVINGGTKPISIALFKVAMYYRMSKGSEIIYIQGKRGSAETMDIFEFGGINPVDVISIIESIEESIAHNSLFSTREVVREVTKEFLESSSEDSILKERLELLGRVLDIVLAWESFDHKKALKLAEGLRAYKGLRKERYSFGKGFLEVWDALEKLCEFDEEDELLLKGVDMLARSGSERYATYLRVVFLYRATELLLQYILKKDYPQLNEVKDLKDLLEKCGVKLEDFRDLYVGVCTELYPQLKREDVRLESKVHLKELLTLYFYLYNKKHIDEKFLSNVKKLTSWRNDNVLTHGGLGYTCDSKFKKRFEEVFRYFEQVFENRVHDLYSLVKRLYE